MGLPSLHMVSLCSGAEGISLSLRLAGKILGFGIQPCVYVEREAFCCGVLATEIEAGNLAPAPIWSDIKTFAKIAYVYRGKADLITAGFPCQPFSSAGKRFGTEDPRHLFPDIMAIVRIIRPRYIFLENVPGLISTRTLLHRPEIVAYLRALDEAAQAARGPRERWHASRHRERLYRRLLEKHGFSALHYVACELEQAGYRVEFGLFSAAEVGASHLRKRLFILADSECAVGREDSFTKGNRTQRRPAAQEKTGGTGDGDQVLADVGIEGLQGWKVLGADIGPEFQTAERAGNKHVADSGSERLRRRGYQKPRERENSQSRGSSDGGPLLAHSTSFTCGESNIEEYKWKAEPGVIIPLFPPKPGDMDEWEAILERRPELAPALENRIRDEKPGADNETAGRTEAPQPSFRGMADEFSDVVDFALADRIDRIRALGNTVVPTTAALAFVKLWLRLHECKTRTDTMGA